MDSVRACWAGRWGLGSVDCDGRNGICSSFLRLLPPAIPAHDSLPLPFQQAGWSRSLDPVRSCPRRLGSGMRGTSLPPARALHPRRASLAALGRRSETQEAVFGSMGVRLHVRDGSCRAWLATSRCGRADSVEFSAPLSATVKRPWKTAAGVGSRGCVDVPTATTPPA
jgi:hypothetical protein